MNPLVSDELMGNIITATAVNNRVMYGLVVVGYKYLIQIQQSELIIERVLLDRGQTRLKEFLNSSVDPIVVCSVNNIKQENLDDSEVKLLEPEEIVVCNDAAKRILEL